MAALGDRSMWSRISIHGEVFPRGFEQVFPVAMVQTQLLLSRDAPLDIHLDWSPFDNTSSDAHFLTLLNSTINHCSRWQWLELVGDVNMAKYITALSRIKSQIPWLHRLEAYLRVNWFNVGSGLNGTDIDFFAAAPALREVFLCKSALGETTKSRSVVFPIPWEQITKYRAALDIDGHLTILHRAQGLRECSLLFLRGENDIPGANIQLLALNKLHVQDTTFLNTLTAPALEEVIVTRRVDSLLPFLRRSEARLTSLTIVEWDPSHEIVPILRYCPALTHLCLALVSDIIPNSVTLTSVLHELGDGDLCPELTSLFWKHETGFAPLDPSTDYQEALHRMITSRWRGKLASLRLFVHGAFGETWVKRIQTPEYEGFDVRVLEVLGPTFIEEVNPP
ncbi:hypothetical protein C8R45DRAFT_1099536 [Mycena sanguinolenta]|nr:hypothetical protein C8R45DRAFT_1099536 [Mycena sanguinolenta]